MLQNTQPSYHLFHCQFDIKWLHLTILYQLILLKQKCRTEKCSEEYETSLNFREFEIYVEHLMSDLIIIALKRYQQIPHDDLVVKSLFTCTCTREMWKLLQLSVGRLHKRNLIPVLINAKLNRYITEWANCKCQKNIPQFFRAQTMFWYLVLVSQLNNGESFTNEGSFFCT